MGQPGAMACLGCIRLFEGQVRDARAGVVTAPESKGRWEQAIERACACVSPMVSAIMEVGSTRDPDLSMGKGRRMNEGLGVGRGVRGEGSNGVRGTPTNVT